MESKRTNVDARLEAMESKVAGLTKLHELLKTLVETQDNDTKAVLRQFASKVKKGEAVLSKVVESVKDLEVKVSNANGQLESFGQRLGKQAPHSGEADIARLRRELAELQQRFDSEIPLRIQKEIRQYEERKSAEERTRSSLIDQSFKELEQAQARLEKRQTQIESHCDSLDSALQQLSKRIDIMEGLVSRVARSEERLKELARDHRDLEKQLRDSLTTVERELRRLEETWITATGQRDSERESRKREKEKRHREVEQKREAFIRDLECRMAKVESELVKCREQLSQAHSVESVHKQLEEQGKTVGKRMEECVDKVNVLVKAHNQTQLGLSDALRLTAELAARVERVETLMTSSSSDTAPSSQSGGEGIRPRKREVEDTSHRRAATPPPWLLREVGDAAKLAISPRNSDSCSAQQSRPPPLPPLPPDVGDPRSDITEPSVSTLIPPLMHPRTADHRGGIGAESDRQKRQLQRLLEAQASKTAEAVREQVEKEEREVQARKLQRIYHQLKAMEDEDEEDEDDAAARPPDRHHWRR